LKYEDLHAFLTGMYVRRIKRKNKDGSEIEYFHLAQNTRHPEKGFSRAGLERLHLGKFLHKDGHILQYTEPVHAQCTILKKFKTSLPKSVKPFTCTP
jgi:hypothetical protein